MLSILIAASLSGQLPKISIVSVFDTYRSQLLEMRRVGLMTGWQEADNTDIPKSRYDLMLLTLTACRNLANDRPGTAGGIARNKRFLRELHPIVNAFSEQLRQNEEDPELYLRGLEKAKDRYDEMLFSKDSFPDIPGNHLFYETYHNLDPVLQRGTSPLVVRNAKAQALTEFTVRTFLMIRNLEDESTALEKSGDRTRAETLMTLIQTVREFVDLCEPYFEVTGLDPDSVDFSLESASDNLQWVANGWKPARNKDWMRRDEQTKPLRSRRFTDRYVYVPDIPEKHYVYEAVALACSAGLERGVMTHRGLVRGGFPLTLNAVTVCTFLFLRNLEDVMADIERSRDRAKAEEFLEIVPSLRILVKEVQNNFEAVGLDPDVVRRDMATLPGRLKAIGS